MRQAGATSRFEASLIPRGLIAFPITPMDAEGRVDAREFERLLHRLASAGVDAACVLGSTGTYAYLSREERRRAVEIAAAALGDRTPLMAGVGALRTDLAVAHARDAREAGAVVGLLAPMSYTPLTEAEVETHFAAVAGQGGLPLCIYDNPAATHFAVSDNLLQALFKVPGVVALKSPAPSADEAATRVAALRKRMPATASLGFSVDWRAGEALIAGGDAWYSVIGGLFPAVAVTLSRAASSGDFDTARRLDRDLTALWALMQSHSGLRVMYAAAHAAGLCTRAPPPPILPLSPSVQAHVAEVVGALRPLLERE